MYVSLGSARRDLCSGCQGSAVQLKEASGIVGGDQAQPASIFFSARRKYAQDLCEMLWFVSSGFWLWAQRSGQ